MRGISSFVMAISGSYLHPGRVRQNHLHRHRVAAGCITGKELAGARPRVAVKADFPHAMCGVHGGLKTGYLEPVRFGSIYGRFMLFLKDSFRP